MRLLDEIFDHLLSNIDVRNHAIAQRPDGFDIIWRFSHHQLGVIADRFDSPDAILGFDGYDRRFVEHDATSAQIYDSIRRSKIDRHVLRRKLEISGEKHDLTISLPVTAMPRRSEEHTSELQSLMRISYAVFC